MNEETKTPQVPDFSGEKMKMPENSDIPQVAGIEKSSNISAPLLLLLVVILLGILAGMYFWLKSLNTVPAPLPMPAIERPTPEQNNEPESTGAEAQADMMGTVSPSDELSAIDADLGSTNLDGVDAELSTIETEMNADLPQ